MERAYSSPSPRSHMDLPRASPRSSRPAPILVQQHIVLLPVGYRNPLSSLQLSTDMIDTDDNYMIRVMHVKSASGESRTLQFPMRLDLDRPKRARTTFSEKQLATLDDHYRRNGYVSGEKSAKLAESLGLTDTQIKVWFQNRRTKDRKKKVSEDEEPSKKQKDNSTTSPSPSSSSSSSSSADLVPPTMVPAAIPAGATLPFPTTFLSIPDFALFPFVYSPQGLLLPANYNA